MAFFGKKLLTNGEESSKIIKLSERARAYHENEVKNFLKNFKKGIDKRARM